MSNDEKNRITVLVENTAQGHGLLAEHGLSFWIATGNRRILFDAGQTGIVSHNAKVLGIDLPSADALILSHGHYEYFLCTARGSMPPQPSGRNFPAGCRYVLSVRGWSCRHDSRK